MTILLLCFWGFFPVFLHRLKGNGPVWNNLASLWPVLVENTKRNVVSQPCAVLILPLDKKGGSAQIRAGCISTILESLKWKWMLIFLDSGLRLQRGTPKECPRLLQWIEILIASLSSPRLSRPLAASTPRPWEHCTRPGKALTTFLLGTFSAAKSSGPC